MNMALVISDDMGTSDLARALLKAMDFDVLVAPAEQTVAQHCVEYRPDVVLVDIEMPGGAGFELISTVRKLAGSALIIGTTRNRHEDLWLRVTEACGADEYVAGPLTPASLAAAMKI